MYKYKATCNQETQKRINVKHISKNEKQDYNNIYKKLP